MLAYSTGMKRAALSFFALFASSTLGCGMLLPQAPGAAEPAREEHAAPKSVIPQESKDVLRKQEEAAYARADEAEDRELDKLEKDALRAIKVALGKEAAFQGGQVGEPSSVALASIRKAKMKVRLEPVTDADGKAVNDDFLQLKDSFTDRVRELQRKIAEHKASPAEMREIQEGSKQIMKLNDLRSAVSAISMQAMMSNSHLQTSSLQAMLRVSQLVRSRKMYEMQLEAGDYALVKRGLERQKRAEAIAATNMAMLAAYQAVLNGGGDPKALDVIGEAALKAFPVKVEVPDEAAKQYVAALGENVSKVRGRYEAMLRKAHGDARYEKSFKAGIDAMFAQAEGAQSQRSASQIAGDATAKYRADIDKCKRGEAIDPGSMVSGPTCKQVHKAAQTGDTSALSGSALEAFGGDKAKLGLAAARGDADGVLDAAGKMLPADGVLGASLQGIAALRKGDARGAINAALGFVPVPGLKEAFGFASKLLFK